MGIGLSLGVTWEERPHPAGGWGTSLISIVSPEFAAVAAAEAAFGTVDILVNNAGIPDAQRAHKMSIELIDQVLGVNLRGPYILSCEVARRLIAAGKRLDLNQNYSRPPRTITIFG